VKIAVTKGLIRPHQKIILEAVPESDVKEALSFQWTFGDGTSASGRKVKHAFPDTAGTLSDGSGRFRVLLDATGGSGHHTLVYVPVVVADALRPAVSSAVGAAGIAYQYRGEMDDTTAPAGVANEVSLAAVPYGTMNYRVTFEGELDVPEDGGYTFVLVANEEAAIDIDGVRLIASGKPVAQVCGLAGMAAQAISGSAALARGRHHLRIDEAHSTGEDDFKLLWQGPSFSLRPVAPDLLTH